MVPSQGDRNWYSTLGKQEAVTLDEIKISVGSQIGNGAVVSESHRRVVSTRI